MALAEYKKPEWESFQSYSYFIDGIIMRTSSKTWTGQVGRYISGIVIYEDWYVPYDSSSVRVQCWGPGGNGGHTDYDSHGGGGGGEYRENTVSVSPGNKFYIGIVYDPTAGVKNGFSSVQGNLVGTLVFLLRASL